MGVAAGAKKLSERSNEVFAELGRSFVRGIGWGAGFLAALTIWGWLGVSLGPLVGE